MMIQASLALQRSSLAPGTLKTYAAMEAKALAGCKLLDIDSEEPLSEQSLCLLAAWFCSRFSSASLKVFVAAVARWQERKFQVPIPRATAWRELTRGVKRVYAGVDAPRQATPFTISHLISLHTLLDDSFYARRSWCMCLFAFFGVLRISEYASDRLRASDVRLIKGATAKWSLVITIPFSKSSEASQEVLLAARGDVLCPVRAWVAYRGALSRVVASSKTAPAFVVAAGSVKVFGVAPFGKFIKAAASRLGLDPDSFSGHSFRRGGATAMFEAGVPEVAIQTHGRWRSDAYKRYIHGTRQVRMMATVGLSSPGAGNT